MEIPFLKNFNLFQRLFNNRVNSLLTDKIIFVTINSVVLLIS